MNKFLDPEQMLSRCWRYLSRAVRGRRHPLCTPAVGTMDIRELWPQLRTVVLREVDADQRALTFFADARSPKVMQLRASPNLTWLFYDPRRQLQIRARGRATLHHLDEVARNRWGELNLAGRRNYASGPVPGTASPESTDGLTPVWASGHLSLADTEYAFNNFLVVRSVIEEMDCLFLHPEGHQRVVFAWRATEAQWEGGWVVA